MEQVKIIAFPFCILSLPQVKAQLPIAVELRAGMEYRSGLNTLFLDLFKVNVLPPVYFELKKENSSVKMESNVASVAFYHLRDSVKSALYLLLNGQTHVI
ncbi:hypothetical protein [uncultured Kriegella sp.]|uniref:hypothetical protein n=1 Tax=uncultured Kriegella sp. TaxID=1798910 RepID=UPI0030DCC1B6